MPDNWSPIDSNDTSNIAISGVSMPRKSQAAGYRIAQEPSNATRRPRLSAFLFFCVRTNEAQVLPQCSSCTRSPGAMPTLPSERSWVIAVVCVGIYLPLRFRFWLHVERRYSPRWADWPHHNGSKRCVWIGLRHAQRQVKWRRNVPGIRHAHVLCMGDMRKSPGCVGMPRRPSPFSVSIESLETVRRQATTPEEKTPL